MKDWNPNQTDIDSIDSRLSPAKKNELMALMGLTENRPTHKSVQDWFLSMEKAAPEAEGFVRYFLLSDGRTLKITLEAKMPE